MDSVRRIPNAYCFHVFVFTDNHPEIGYDNTRQGIPVLNIQIADEVNERKQTMLPHNIVFNTRVGRITPAVMSFANVLEFCCVPCNTWYPCDAIWYHLRKKGIERSRSNSSWNDIAAYLAGLPWPEILASKNRCRRA